MTRNLKGSAAHAGKYAVEVLESNGPITGIVDVIVRETYENEEGIVVYREFRSEFCPNSKEEWELESIDYTEGVVA